MTIGIVTGYSGVHAAGLEEFFLSLIDGLEKVRPPGITYRIYTRAGNGLGEALRKRGQRNFSIVPVPFGPLWKSVGLFFVPRSDVYLWNGPLTAHVISPTRSAVLVYDFAYRHFGEFSMRARMLDFFSRLLFRRVKKIITISQATQNELVHHYGVLPAKIEVIYPGVKNLSVVVPEPVDIPPHGYFLFVGTTKERKNILNLIRGFASVKDKIPQDLLVAGHCDLSSPYGQKVKAFMHEEALEGRVRFLGKVSEGTLKYLYQHALAFTFPSAFEGFGMPVVEAMMEGTPVLTSNVSSLPEAAGGAALLVDPFDPTAIGEGLLELVQNESLRQELRAKGFMSAERFSWEKSAKTLTKVLSAL